MAMRTLTLEVPASWTDAELEERLRRLREPAETAEQRAKSGARVALETRALASTIQRVEELLGRVDLLETHADQVDRTIGSLPTTQTTDDLDARLRELVVDLGDARAAVELAEKRLAQRADELASDIAGKLKKLWSSIGGLKRHQAKEVTK